MWLMLNNRSGSEPGQKYPDDSLFPPSDLLLVPPIGQTQQETEQGRESGGWIWRTNGNYLAQKETMITSMFISEK